ncbi:FAD-dependent oxidoreductase [Akkermansiaceae bacterium]|nr:FAD-dependent oxidoreductase [Akkermansiaceae bacterium]
MTTRLLPLLFSLLTALPTQAETHSADIIVYGDSPSAITAAIEAADNKKNVLLVSPVQHLGGIIANGLGSQDVDRRAGNGKPIGGLTREFFIRIAKVYDPKATDPKYQFRSSFAEKAINDWLSEKNISVLRGKRITPLSPPSDPVQMRLQSPPAKSKFLAVRVNSNIGALSRSSVDPVAPFPQPLGKSGFGFLACLAGKVDTVGNQIMS